MIPPCGTFDYVVTVPEGPSGGPWKAVSRHPVPRTGNRHRDARLVGLTPRVLLSDEDPPSNPGYDKGVWRPNVPRSRITLTASKRKQAQASSAWFHLDRGFCRLLQRGDSLHLVRTDGCGIGVSIIRGGELVAAAGALRSVPLAGLEVRTPTEALEGAMAAFAKRDPEFEFSEIPLEVSDGNRRYVMYRGIRNLEHYRVRVFHGFFDYVDGAEESVAISRDDCPDAPVAASAILLDVDPIEIERW